MCFKSSILLYAHKQFVLVFVAFWNKFKFEATPERCFHKTITSINLGFFLFIFVMLTKCCIFAIKTESWLFVKVVYWFGFWWIPQLFEKTFGFLSFSVIVTLVDSRDGLVEPLLWSFVIAPLLSYFLNFCKGTITVIVLKSEYRCNAVCSLGNISSDTKKKMSKIKLNLLLEFWFQ